MTTPLDWDGVRLRLGRLRDSVSAEIRNYPAPIPACDAQYNHLLEQREQLSAALARLDAARMDGSSTLESFVAELPILDQGGRSGD